jgi:hypothetical protein
VRSSAHVRRECSGGKRSRWWLRGLVLCELPLVLREVPLVHYEVCARPLLGPFSRWQLVGALPTPVQSLLTRHLTP